MRDTAGEASGGEQKERAVCALVRINSTRETCNRQEQREIQEYGRSQRSSQKDRKRGCMHALTRARARTHELARTQTHVYVNTTTITHSQPLSLSTQQQHAHAQPYPRRLERALYTHENAITRQSHCLSPHLSLRHTAFHSVLSHALPPPSLSHTHNLSPSFSLFSFTHQRHLVISQVLLKVEVGGCSLS